MLVLLALVIPRVIGKAFESRLTRIEGPETWWNRRGQKGFLALVAASGICMLALLTTCLLGIWPKRYVDYGTTAAAYADITTLEGALNNFRHDCGRYPATAEGLAALTTKPAHLKMWKGPYLTKRMGPDPWGNSYLYTRDAGDRFTLRSNGSDGKPGGEGEAADVVETGE